MIMKKQQDIPQVADTSTSRKTTTVKSASRKEKKVDGRTVEGRESKIQSEYEKVKKEYEELSAHLVRLKKEHKTMLSTVRTLEMLLASYNAIISSDDVTLMTPLKGTQYWYIRAMASIKRFEVVDAVWKNSTSDHYRYTKGNMYLDMKVAETACRALNIMLVKISH